MVDDKDKILEICERLSDLGFVKEIKVKKYSVHCLVRNDVEYQEDSYLVRDRIKFNFSKMGYLVNVLGTYWLEIVFEDVKTRIDDCFKQD